MARLDNNDGRAQAVKLLKDIFRLNGDFRQDIHKSRDVMVAALEKFSDLPAKERVRFATILNDTISHAYSGVVVDPDIYDRGRPELTHMRMSTEDMRMREAQEEAAA